MTEADGFRKDNHGHVESRCIDNMGLAMFIDHNYILCYVTILHLPITFLAHEYVCNMVFM